MIPADARVPAKADSKRFATLQARAALWGATLTPIEADDGVPQYVISRWALTRAFADLGEVAHFFDQVGAPA